MTLYEIWNDILLDFFFSDCHNEEIFLSVDYDELMDYASHTNRFDEHVEKINIRRIARGEQPFEKIEQIPNLFRQAFIGKEYSGISQLQHLIREKTSVTRNEPQTLPLIALFMMPVANRPDLNSNNYYTKTTEFLRSLQIIPHNQSLSCGDFSSISTSLKKMWQQLEDWAANNKYSYHVKIKFSDNRNAYVAPFLAEALLSAVQRMLFKRVFYKAGLVVGQELNYTQILDILHNYGHIITYNDKKKFTQKLNDFEGALVSAFKQAYNKWDGTTIVVTKTSTENGRTKSSYEDEGAVNRLYISMSSWHGEYTFSLIANIHNSENCEFYEYTGEFGGYEFYVDGNGIADESIRSDKIISAISTGKEVVFHNRQSENDTLRYVPDDLIILEAYHSKFISKVSINKGGHYYVLVRNSQRNKYEHWLHQNEAKLCNYHNLKNGYFLFEIDSLQYAKDGLSSLSSSSRKNIRLDSTLIVGHEGETILLFKGLPAYFIIEGVDLTSNCIRAVFNSDGLIEEELLEYNADLRMWKLSVINDSIKVAKAFVIYDGSERLSSSSYKFSSCDFPNEYEEISYNEYGEYQPEQSVFNGLNISSKINVNLPTLVDNMHKYGSEPNFEHFNYVNKDYLLYALSTHSVTDKKYVDNAISALVANNIAKLKEGLTNRIIDNYCRMGYINYAYSNNKHVIAVNKPTLIWLPSIFAANSIVSSQERVSATLTVKNCAESYFKFLLTGARTPIFISNLISNAQKYGIKVQIDEYTNPLYPQRIILWSETIEKVRIFADNNGIQFENCVYASSLLNKLSNIDSYIEHITKEESDKDYGGIQNSLCGYDYTAKDYTSFTIHTPIVNKESAIVTYFPGTYSRQTILWKNGRQYDIDLFWSYFVGMKLGNHKLAHFDKENSVITMPIHIKLPMLFARALTMITGDIPSYINNLRQYKVANNPFTESVEGSEILKKLGQN